MHRRALLLAGIAALTAVPAHASVRDFRLPSSETPTPTPRPQGPVDPEGGVLRPSPAPTASPTPTLPPTVRPSPAPSPAQGAVVQPVPARPTPTPSATRSPTGRPSDTPEPAPSASAEPAPLPSASADGGDLDLPAFSPTPAPQATGDIKPPDDGGWPWGWLVAILALAAAAAGAFLWMRQRATRSRGTVLVVPEIEKPRVPPKPEPAAEDAPSFAQPPTPELAATAAAPETAGAEHPLHILIQPMKLAQTVMNMTLSYRLELTNGGDAPLEDVAVAADLVGAHASLPREAQLADTSTVLPEAHRIASIAPGETVQLKGDLRLPLSAIVPIRQGAAVIFVPLARFRATARDNEPRCFTVAVGQPSDKGALQPVRLDLGLRWIEGLGGRAF